jgi:hypothetical protein
LFKFSKRWTFLFGEQEVSPGPGVPYKIAGIINYAFEQRNKNFFLSVPIIGNQNGVDKKARKSLNSEYESGSTAPLVGSF